MPTIRLLLLITGNLRTLSASMCRTALARSSASALTSVCECLDPTGGRHDPAHPRERFQVVGRLELRYVTAADNIIIRSSRWRGRVRPNSLQLQNDRAFRDGRRGGANVPGVLTDPIPCHPNALVGAGLVLIDRYREPAASGADQGIAHKTVD